MCSFNKSYQRNWLSFRYNDSRYDTYIFVFSRSVSIFLILGILISISGLFGLPWICAAPVRSIAHVASLSKYSNTHAPGEKARLIDIKDQRVTNIGVHLFIGCTIFAAPIIRKIPVAALFGIFLYFGIVSISGTQLFSRLKMTFIPTKYHPNFGYLRRVREWLI